MGVPDVAENAADQPATEELAEGLAAKRPAAGERDAAGQGDAGAPAVARQPAAGELAEHTADVIVVGAGPAGSTAAFHLAQAGLDVLLLEKTAFPREKVCGDGLTPRAVKELITMGIDISEEAGWLRNKGLRMIAAGRRVELDWPELASFPDFGLVRKRDDFDELLARTAEKAGARLHERCNVSGPLRDERTGRMVGVHAKLGEEKKPVTFRAPVVVAADGNSSRLSLAMGLHRDEKRPMAVAVRTYFTSPWYDDDYLEAWLELWDQTKPEKKLLPGYGWIFGMGDGTSNVGLGGINTTAAFKEVDWREVLRAWTAGMPQEWQFTPEHMTGPIRGSALPMAFNRKPHYAHGLLLVGDAAGMVNPFNGEGIAYAMESGRIVADVVSQALARSTPAQRELALRRYPVVLKENYGGYYTLGRVFAQAIGNPRVMKFAAEHSLNRTLVTRFLVKLMANLTDPRGGDAMDRVINGLRKMAPRS